MTLVVHFTLGFDILVELPGPCLSFTIIYFLLPHFSTHCFFSIFFFASSCTFSLSLHPFIFIWKAVLDLALENNF